MWLPRRELMMYTTYDRMLSFLEDLDSHHELSAGPLWDACNQEHSLFFFFFFFFPFGMIHEST
jgi:hypothetical protein